MRKNPKLNLVETGDFVGEVRPTIHAIKNSRELFDIYRLTYDCYRTQGHLLTRLDGLWIPYPNFDHIPQTTIFVAELEGEVVGSVSVTLDGAKGLPMDQEFFRTCALIRSCGRRIAQVWRILVKESCALHQPIFSSLVAGAVNHLLSHGVQTGLFVVQDRQEEPCRRLINGTTLMQMMTARGLSNAKSVIMRADSENLQCALADSASVPSRIASTAGR